MSRLLIGIPARNEADHIVELADRIERGAELLGSSHRCRIALAYQASGDDTLVRYVDRPSEIPQLVLNAPGDVVGKGANVKLLVQRALDDRDDYLLLVDADLVGYDPRNLADTIGVAENREYSLVLPLWSRPIGQGNTTNYLACPLVFATYGARVRQPIAGHMLLHRRLLERLDLDAFPDDYGIDIMITLTALAASLSVGQVPLVAPEHPSKFGNSERVMTEVATAVLGALGARPGVDRSDIDWPDGYWEGWTWPRSHGVEPNHVDVILRHARSEGDLERWLTLSDNEMADTWCDHLVQAIGQARSRQSDLARIAESLVLPFFVHAEYRKRRGASVAELERYVADLGFRLAARLHG